MKNNFIFLIKINLLIIAIISIYNTNCLNTKHFSRNIIDNISYNKNYDYEWCIIGGGPAGIIIIGVLLDLGVPLESIKWIDPKFQVGRIGEFYHNVSANSINETYLKFIESCNTFKKIKSQNIDNLYKLKKDGYENLKIISDVLQDISDYFLEYIPHEKGFVENLSFENKTWSITLQENSFTSKNIILATGASPKNLKLENENQEVIPLDIALDKNKLEKLVNNNDIIAVFGGAHSAILVLKYLSEININKINNFYKYPLKYCKLNDNGVFENINGLKGFAAAWAKEFIENGLPENLFRYKMNEENIKNYLNECNKIIYAIGYERTNVANGNIFYNGDYFEIEFDPKTGRIGPNIFGIGIAFPPEIIENGIKENLIGINSFMLYAQQVAPNWINRLISLEIDDILKTRLKLNELHSSLKVYAIS